MVKRQIIHIDEEKCDGCGQCVPSCEEGAIQIVDGKAKLVSDVYCDGLGACLGQCPQGALSVVEREADAFDEEAVAHHLAATKRSLPASAAGGCPGAAATRLREDPASQQATAADRTDTTDETAEEGERSGLANWPVQLHLVPPHAPYLQQADVLLVADCVPFACADFHRRFLDGRPVVIGCPKLDDGQAYVQKLAQIILASSIRSITVLHMEVPCCAGLLRIAEAAVQLAATETPVRDATISIRGSTLPTASNNCPSQTGGVLPVVSPI
jgi:Pyruvate/2-oxoacid:ferredoxin oxidoreductase delta subunit